MCLYYGNGEDKSIKKKRLNVTLVQVKCHFRLLLESHAAKQCNLRRPPINHCALLSSKQKGP